MQKNIYWLLLVGLIAASCGNAKKDQAGTLNDKKAKLEKLKTEQKNINQQIAALETEIAAQDPNAANNQNAKLVSLTTIAPDSFAHYIELQGTVNAQNIAYVTPRGPGGQVKAIYVQQGQSVSKGQLLMKLDDATARTQVEQIQSQLSYAKDLYQRQQNLWKQDIGTEVQLLNAKNNVTNLEKQLQLA